ncbi:LuxR C-terminal-related transcriptional regulator [Labilithrix luteola]|nr:LuxR C-terminal-related transcriptional regulator [Labilithrix luteola]
MGVSLSPRIEATLEHLLTGASDKEIAVRLDLSPHTVRQYVKTI